MCQKHHPITNKLKQTAGNAGPFLALPECISVCIQQSGWYVDRMRPAMQIKEFPPTSLLFIACHRLTHWLEFLQKNQIKREIASILALLSSVQFVY